jgi:hypothetical protein
VHGAALPTDGAAVNLRRTNSAHECLELGSDPTGVGTLPIRREWHGSCSLSRERSVADWLAALATDEQGGVMARRSTEAVATALPEFRALIAERAYYKAEKRGFVPGHELEDWLAAEREIAALDAGRAATASTAKRAVSRGIKKLK